MFHNWSDYYRELKLMRKFLLKKKSGKIFGFIKHSKDYSGETSYFTAEVPRIKLVVEI